jgi:DNA-binding HxlR family transcriptional regulator
MTSTPNGTPTAGTSTRQAGSWWRRPTRKPRASQPVDACILDLIRRPYLAEILSALAEQPHTLATLRRHTGAPRRAAVAALRALAAHHAISRTTAAGSWDTTRDRHVRYQLTAAGRALVEQLSSLDVWTALYQ